MNSYGDLTTLKNEAYLNISTTDAVRDVRLLRQLEAASRMIDKYCRRFFYTYESTWYYDGWGDTAWFDDILSITTLKTDEDGDTTFENTLTEDTDFYQYPLQGLPKTHAKIAPNGSYGSFANGMKKGVEIAGIFGYGDGVSGTPYVDAGTDVNEAGDVTATQTTITVDAGTSFAHGQTIRIDTEQMYVPSISTHILTVERGVNGTTATTHLNNADIYIYEYPWDIVHGCLIQAMRWYKRKDSAYQDIVGIPEMGTFVTSKGLDPDVKMILGQYKKVMLR